MSERESRIENPPTTGASDEESTGLATRRSILKTGAWLIPSIVTLHATPASAGNDYTMVAYRYGDHAGLCRNPRFNPHAQGGPRSEEFVPCSENDSGGRGGRNRNQDGWNDDLGDDREIDF